MPLAKQAHERHLSQQKGDAFRKIVMWKKGMILEGIIPVIVIGLFAEAALQEARESLAAVGLVNLLNPEGKAPFPV